MNRDEFLRRLDGLTIWKQGGVRAPHKPLLLLLTLGRVAGGRGRLASYGEEVEENLRTLLKRFGPPRPAHHPEEPYFRLRNDGIWEIPGLPAGGDRVPPLKELRPTRGGFPDSVYELLRRHPDLIEDAACRLLETHFPASLHADIRDAAGLPDYAARRRDPATDPWLDKAAAAGTLAREAPAAAAGAGRGAPRDPRFRDRVLRAYERCCAVCGFDVRVDDQLLGLEAAHIKWHAAGGPDCVPNGVALCTLHHKALDVGALGLESAGEQVVVLVSKGVSGQSAADRHLFDFTGEPLRLPRSREDAPSGEFLAWHRREVFREPPVSA